MKKIFKFLFTFMIAITLFQFTDVMAAREIDETNKTITNGEYVANYEISDGILKITFPEPTEEQAFDATEIAEIFIENFYSKLDIWSFGMIADYTLESELLELEYQDLVYSEGTTSIPKTLKLKLISGMPVDVVWAGLKEDYESFSYDTLEDDLVLPTILFDEETGIIETGLNKIKYTLEDGILKLVPNTEEDKIEKSVAKKLVEVYIYEAGLEYNILPLSEIEGQDYGMTLEEDSEDESIFKSMTLDLNKNDNDPEELLSKIIDYLNESNELLDEDELDDEDSKSQTGSEVTSTKVKVGDTATAYSKIALVSGVVCILIGAGVIAVMVINNKKKAL